LCSSGGEVAQTDEALQQSQDAFSKVLTQNYNLAFGQQQAVLGQQVARLNYMVANPLGYTPTELHTAKASINDQTATAAKQALGKAAAFAAAHGASDVGGGGAGQIAGEIASEATQSKAQQLSQLSEQNAALKRQNFNSALEGLNAVGSEYGSSAGTAAGTESGVASTSTTAGQGATAAKEAGWDEFGGVLSGIAGLGKAIPLSPIKL